MKKTKNRRVREKYRGKLEEQRDTQGKRSRENVRYSINSSMNLNLLTYDPEAETAGGNCNSISLAYLKKTMQIHNFMFFHQRYYLLHASVLLGHFAPVIVQKSKERGSSRKTEIQTSGWNAFLGTFLISACCVYHGGKTLLGKKGMRAKDKTWLTPAGCD